MSDIAEHVFRVLGGFGYDYSGCMAIVEEIVQGCEVTGMSPEDFDNTIANYRTQYTNKPSGWSVLARFRPRRADIDKAQQQACNHIFHWIEREGWKGGLGVIYEGICGIGPKLLAKQWGLDAQGPEYAGLPDTWQQYFELLHNGNMYAAYVFMAHSNTAQGRYWQQLATQAETNPKLALSNQPYLRKLVRSGKVQLTNPTVSTHKKRKWVIPASQEINVPAKEPDEFLFDIEDETEGR